MEQRDAGCRPDRRHVRQRVGAGGTAGKLVFCSLNQGMQILTDASPHASVTAGDGGCLLDVFSDARTIHHLG